MWQGLDALQQGQQLHDCMVEQCSKIMLQSKASRLGQAGPLHGTVAALRRKWELQAQQGKVGGVSHLWRAWLQNASPERRWRIPGMCTHQETPVDASPMRTPRVASMAHLQQDSKVDLQSGSTV